MTRHANGHDNDIYFLGRSGSPERAKEGVMICTGGDTAAADKGRAFSKRTDPW